MPISRKFLKSHNFMLTIISGELNDQNLKDHVVALNKETEGVLNLRELGDCREMNNLEGLSVEGTANSASMENDRPYSLLAIIVDDRSLHFGLARAYQAFSEDRRKDVKIFKSMDEGLSWLAIDKQEYEILSDFIKTS